MALSANEIFQLIQVASREGVDSLKVGDIEISFKGGRKALEAAGIPLAGPLGQIAQEVAAFDTWNQDLPEALKAQIASIPVEE